MTGVSHEPILSLQTKGITIPMMNDRSSQIIRPTLERHYTLRRLPISPDVSLDPPTSRQTARIGSAQVLRTLLVVIAVSSHLACGGYYKLVDCNGTFSPDGSKIAFCSRRAPAANGERDQDIWLMNADGTNQHCLIRNQGDHVLPGYETRGCWSPDSKSLLAGMTAGETHWLTGYRYGYQFVVVDLQGNVVRQIARPPGIIGSPRFHPNGRQLIWSGEKGLWLTNLDSSDPRQICSIGSGYFHASRDGNRLVFGQVAYSRSRAFSVDLTTAIVNDLGGGLLVRINDDGSTIALGSLGGQSEVYLMDFNGSNRRRLLDNEQVSYGSDMCFSPIGDKLAYQKKYTSEINGQRRTQNGLCISDIQSRSIREYPKHGGMTAMQFSPDGRSLLYLGGPHGDMGLYLVDLESGSFRRLTPQSPKCAAGGVDSK